VLGWGPALLVGAPIGLVNPSAEITGGVDGGDVNGPLVPGWGGVDGQVNRGGIDFGNGAWRLSYEDGGELFQMTGHVIEAGASYSLRFDAANMAGPTGGAFVADLVLVDGDLRNGHFNAGSGGRGRFRGASPRPTGG
jgi:hypothetical protein